MRHVMSEADRLGRLGGFMETVTAARPAAVESPSRKEPGLSASALRLVIEAAWHPVNTLLELYKSAGFSGAGGKRAVDELIALRMVRPLPLVRIGRGGRPTVLQVLEAGVEELVERGITPAGKVVTRGSDEHDVYGRIIGRCEEADGSKVAYEKPFGQKIFDVLSEREGKYVGFEVVLSGSAKWNAQQALKAAAVQGVDQVVVACKDRKLLGRIESELVDLGGEDRAREKVRGKFLGEYVTKVFG